MTPDPFGPKVTEAFPASTEMLNDLIETLSSEEYLNLPLSTVKALIAVRGVELIEKMKEEAFALQDEKKRDKGLEHK